MGEVIFLTKSFEDKILRSTETSPQISMESVAEWIKVKREELLAIITNFINCSENSATTSPTSIKYDTRHLNTDESYLKGWVHYGGMESFLEVFICKELTEFNVWVKLVIHENLSCSLVLKRVTFELKYVQHNIPLSLEGSESLSVIKNVLDPYSYILVQRYKFKNTKFPEALLKFDNATFDSHICYSMFTITVADGSNCNLKDILEDLPGVRKKRSKIIQYLHLHDIKHYKALKEKGIVEESYKNIDDDWLFLEEHIWEEKLFKMSTKSYFKQFTTFKDASDDDIAYFKNEMVSKMNANYPKE